MVADVSQRRFKVEESLAVAEQRDKLIVLRIDELNQIIDTSIARQRGAFVKSDSKLTLTYSESEVKELLREVQRLTFEQRLGIARIRSKANRISELHNYAKWALFSGFLLSAMGLVLASFGFLLWYRKVQRPLDIIAENGMNTSLHDDLGSEDSSGRSKAGETRI